MNDSICNCPQPKSLILNKYGRPCARRNAPEELRVRFAGVGCPAHDPAVQWREKAARLAFAFAIENVEIHDRWTLCGIYVLGDMRRVVWLRMGHHNAERIIEFFDDSPQKVFDCKFTENFKLPKFEFSPNFFARYDLEDKFWQWFARGLFSLGEPADKLEERAGVTLSAHEQIELQLRMRDFDAQCVEKNRSCQVKQSHFKTEKRK